MNEYLEILFFAIIAGGVLWKLSRVLGYDDSETKNAVRTVEKIVKVGADDDFSNSRISDDVVVEEEEDIPQEHKQGIEQIKAQDASFSLKNFMSNAENAFEEIIEAYSKGHKNVLEPLLSDDLFKRVSKSIDKRNEKKEVLEHFIVAICDVHVSDVKVLGGSKANISLVFISEQIKLIKDQEGKIISGDPNKIDKVKDVWAFEKKISSSDPIWRLCSI